MSPCPHVALPLCLPQASAAIICDKQRPFCPGQKVVGSSSGNMIYPCVDWMQVDTDATDSYRLFV